MTSSAVWIHFNWYFYTRRFHIKNASCQLHSLETSKYWPHWATSQPAASSRSWAEAPGRQAHCAHRHSRRASHTTAKGQAPLTTQGALLLQWGSISILHHQEGHFRTGGSPHPMRSVCVKEPLTGHEDTQRQKPEKAWPARNKASSTTS